MGSPMQIQSDGVRTESKRTSEMYKQRGEKLCDISIHHKGMKTEQLSCCEMGFVGGTENLFIDLGISLTISLLITITS